MVLMLLQEAEPDAHRLLVPVLDLDQSAHGDALKVLLRFLEDEGVARDGPALGDAGQGDGALGGQGEEVGGAEGEVGEEFDVAHAVGADLEVADGHAVFGDASERPEVCGLDGAGQAGAFEDFLGFVREGSVGCIELTKGGFQSSFGFFVSLRGEGFIFRCPARAWDEFC